MFARFRNKASAKPEMPEEVAAVPPDVETDNVDSVEEIEKARQDLMRAAMEAIAMPAAEPELSVSESSMEEDIPVIRVRINRPKPPTPEVEPEPETPAASAAPSAQKETVAPAESPPAPVEPDFSEQKVPETTEAETAQRELPEVVPVRSEPMVVEPEERSDTIETADRESAPERVPEVYPELQETLSQNGNLREEETFGGEYARADSTGMETFPVDRELPLEDISEEQPIENQENIPEEEVIAVIFPETELLSSRVMAFAEAENEFAPVGISPEEISLESPASEISPANVSFPARPGEQPADTSIAQLDDIMIDIVKQDIASHRRRISRSDGGN